MSEAKPFASQRESIRYLQDEFAIGQTQPDVYLLFQRLRIQAEEPHPTNKNADKEAQTKYKKMLLRK